MATTTIIYYTDNSLGEPIFSRCQEELKRAAGDKPIISVSQKPIDLGTNICLGEIGRSYTSYYRQILEGAKAAKTEYVATVEHDCLYAPEHFDFIPPTKDKFYYDTNIWFVTYETGMYSYYKRKVQSMMICFRELLIEAIEEKMQMSSSDYPSTGRAKFTCEPGVCDHREEYIEAKTEWCKKHERLFKQYECMEFKTENPCVDIRHQSNFSRPGSYKVSSQFTDSIPYWGKFKI